MNFWKDALAQAAGGLILAAMGGVGFLVYSVPSQLNQVLQNQKAFSDRFVVVEQRLEKAETNINGIQIRLTRIEER